MNIIYFYQKNWKFLKMFLPVFHLSVVLINSFTIWYDQAYVETPFPTKQLEELPLKARYLFLTVWCLVLQNIYFFISFLNDIGGTNAVTPKKAPLIRRIKDILFSLAFPTAIYVSLAFWAIYFVDKELIFPEEIATAIPAWMNHVMHTFIVPFIFIELMVTKRDYPSRKLGLNIMNVFVVAYILWVMAVYVKTGVWAYPFLEYFGWPLRFAFWSSSFIGATAIYIVGEKINYAVSPRTKVYANGVNVKSH